MVIQSKGENGKWRQGKIIVSKVIEVGGEITRVEQHEIIIQPGTALLIEVEAL